MVWRRYTWRGVLIFLVAVAVAMGCADLVAGIFKHSGPLKSVWPSFPVRMRPMFSPGLEDVHVVSTRHGLYGTVSAHAATIVSLALLSSVAVGRKWFTAMMVVVALLICYSRIYLACHFPQDILLGAARCLCNLIISAQVCKQQCCQRQSDNHTKHTQQMSPA